MSDKPNIKDLSELEGATIKRISGMPLSSLTIETNKGEITIFGNALKGITVKESKNGMAISRDVL